MELKWIILNNISYLVKDWMLVSELWRVLIGYCKVHPVPVCGEKPPLCADWQTNCIPEPPLPDSSPGQRAEREIHPSVDTQLYITKTQTLCETHYTTSSTCFKVNFVNFSLPVALLHQSLPLFFTGILLSFVCLEQDLLGRWAPFETVPPSFSSILHGFLP